MRNGNLIPILLSNQYFDFFNFNGQENITLIYAVFCFIITLKREVIKDIEDYKGDKETGSHKYSSHNIRISSTKVYIYIIFLVELFYMYLCFRETIYELKFTFFIYFNWS